MVFLKNSLLTRQEGQKLDVKAAAYLSVKILAIYTFIKFATYLQVGFSIRDIVMVSTDKLDLFIQLILMLAPVLLLLFISMCLWLYTDEISQRMVKNLTISTQVSVNYQHLQSIAFSVVGAVILADALPMLVSAIMHYAMFESRKVDQLISIGSQGIKLLIGAWFLFGSQGIVGLIKSLRTAGLKNEGSNEGGNE